jgi:Fe-S cluster assembly iron-binding protein IscA
LSLEERPLTDDRTHTFEDLKILIHEQDFIYFDHTKLDYVTDSLGIARFQLQQV